MRIQSPQHNNHRSVYLYSLHLAIIFPSVLYIAMIIATWLPISTIMIGPVPTFVSYCSSRLSMLRCFSTEDCKKTLQAVFEISFSAGGAGVSSSGSSFCAGGAERSSRDNVFIRTEGVTTDLSDPVRCTTEALPETLPDEFSLLFVPGVFFELLRTLPGGQKFAVGMDKRPGI